MKESGTIFDLVQPELSGKEGYLEIAKNAPQPKDNSFLSSVADYGKTILKGSIEGLSRLGKIMGPTHDLPRVEQGKLIAPRTSEQELEEQTESLDTLLPTDEGFVQSGLRRGLKEAPSMIGFPSGAPLQAGARTLIGGFAGEGAKELGLPEWAQTAAEITTQIGPDVTKKLLQSGKNKEIIEAGKKLGLSDEQLTPLIQSDFKQKWLTKLSPKRGATQKALQETKLGLGKIYSHLHNAEAASGEISESQNGKLINTIYDKLSKMPRGIQKKISGDLKDLLNNKITGKSLINFYQDIGSHFGSKTKQLGLLKEPIKEALNSISPSLGKDFEMATELFSKYSQIAKKLKPTLVSDLIVAGEALGILSGIGLGYPSLTTILSEQAAKKLSQQMLINPHLQQLSEKTLLALNQNKSVIAKKLIDSMAKILKKESPEASEKLKEISLEDLQQLISPASQDAKQSER